MKSSKELPLPPEYKHQIDTRTEMEKLLSDHIVRNLSELNFKRVHTKKSQCSSYHLQNKYFFICLSGLPPIDKQFDSLDLPGEKVVYSMTGLNGNYTQKEYLKIYQNISLTHEADNVAKIVQKVPQNLKIVFVFHSFGGWIFSAYSNKYGHSKIFGLIDLGSIPIRFYPILIYFLKPVAGGKISDEKLLQNADQFYNTYLQATKKSGAVVLKNKYEYIIWLKLVKSKELTEMFQWSRYHPKVLKAILFGRRDEFFLETLLNQKVIYYSYVDKLDPIYEQKLKQAYQKIYNTKVSNVQQRFAFNFETGKHSLHLQPKLEHDISTIIRQYLWVIDEASQIK